MTRAPERRRRFGVGQTEVIQECFALPLGMVDIVIGVLHSKEMDEYIVVGC